MDKSIRMVCVKLTYKCNLNCFMCGQRKMQYEKRCQEIDLENIKKVIEECGDLRYGVYLWGGEPLVYSQFGELLSYLYDNRIFTTINTNGVNLNKFTELMASYEGFSKIIVSIDGIGETHDRIRGISGTFNRISNNLAKLNSMRKKNLMIASNTVVTSENYGSLFEIINGISELGVDTMECQLPMFFSDLCGANYENVLMSEFGMQADTWSGFRGDYSNIEIPILLSELKKIQQKFGRRFRLVPNLSETDLQSYFTTPDDNLKTHKCSLPFSQVSIEPNGDVVICPDFPDYIVGNIYDESINSIWQNERINQFRKYIMKNNLSLCSRCCNFYQF
ncbi:radical SAM protein [Clostridium zeae]|uniref:Radical SAM protein n=2 Tax=Clostridium zeae TaxID=2759022 RepID=A0ABQ1E824_9CLOT|nr:radical SAM protein [Clostridium zeae]